jgi:Protein O-mannosyl-transferase TMEM260-like
MGIFKKYYGLLTGIFAFIVYLLTVSHSIAAFDCGELAAVQATLGIAHPPGYPLFTILGYLFVHIPLGLTKIYQLNILCSVWCAAAVVLFTYTSKLVLDNLPKLKTRKTSPRSEKIYGKINDKGPDSELIIYITSILSGLFFAFSLLVWLQSVSVEVYSLQIFLFTLIIFFYFKAFFYSDENGTLFSGKNKNWLYVAIFFGLGLSNHLMTFYLLPAFCFLYFYKYSFNKKSVLKFLAMAAISIFIAVGLYTYLIIRSNQNPVLNWGNPDNIKNAIYHISARYYKGNFFSGVNSVERQLKFLFNSFGFYNGKPFAGDFNIFLIFPLLGMVVSFIAFRKFFYFFLLLFLTTVFFTINYNIPDIYEYFSLSVISIYIISVPGILLFINYLRSEKYSFLVPVIILVIFLVVRVNANYVSADESHNHIIEDYARSLLYTADDNAVIFSNQWDYFVSPSYYLQYAEKYRPDITVFHTDLLSYSWYHQEFKRKNKVIYNSKNDKVNLSYLFKNFVDNIYLTPEVVRDWVGKGRFIMSDSLRIIPDILMFRVVNKDEYFPAKDPDFVIRIPNEQTTLTRYIENLIGAMLTNRINYELQYNKLDRARLYYQELVNDFPDYPVPDKLKRLFENN